jgi:hypothetical protein
MFRAAWWASNALLAVALLGLMYSGVREYSVRRYLDGFSDAIVPNFLPAEQKVEAILDWMRAEPSRGVATNPDESGRRDPQMTLNERWVIIDPAYRVMMRDAKGRYLTRKDLRDPAIFAEATDAVANYGKEYTYDHYAYVRMARLPLDGLHLRRVLDWINPGWDEAVDWSLLLERESFFYLVLSATATIFFLIARGMLAYYADRRLRIPRFQLREHMIRVSTTFVSTPEIKQ